MLEKYHSIYLTLRTYKPSKYLSINGLYIYKKS